MNVYRHYEDLGSVPYPVVTTGTFDGVHIGHQKIINDLKQRAASAGGETVLLTFFPHPRMVLHPNDHGLQLLSTQEEKIRLLEKAGIDHLIVHPFTRDFSRVTSVEYVRDILVNNLGTKQLVIGYDHHFGRNREGNFEHLVELSPLYGFEVVEISAQDIDDVNVSSTKIRSALLEGDVETANRYLGYQYPLSGIVTHGAGIGRTLGFPTANVHVPDTEKLIPGNGVYAVEVLVDGKEFGGMLNIGVRPTVDNQGKRSIEVHVLNFEGDLYGKRIHMQVKHRLRNEQKFESLDALKDQLGIDRQRALQLLG